MYFFLPFHKCLCIFKEKAENIRAFYACLGLIYNKKSQALWTTVCIFIIRRQEKVPLTKYVDKATIKMIRKKENHCIVIFSYLFAFIF